MTTWPFWQALTSADQLTMQNAAPISVIICAYTEQRWDALVNCVLAVQNQTIPPLEVIVVIDHNPHLLDSARKNLSGVRLIENREPRGLSGARNSALTEARGAVIAFIDEDAIPAADWLEKLSASYADPQVMGVGGAIEPVWVGGRPGWFPSEFNWVVGCTYRGMPLEPAPVRNLIGCNMSFRREIFERAGYFRNGIGRIGVYPVGCEETELCIRASQSLPGSILLYQPAARVSHLVPAHRARWRYFRDRCYAEGLSKALVTQFVGTQDGLASERSYTLRTLPQGVARGLAHYLLHRDPAGAMRAGAIIAGLVITTTGYLAGRLSQLLAPFKQSNWSVGFYGDTGERNR